MMLVMNRTIVTMMVLIMMRMEMRMEMKIRMIMKTKIEVMMIVKVLLMATNQLQKKQARKPRSYASSKLRPSD